MKPTYYVDGEAFDMVQRLKADKTRKFNESELREKYEGALDKRFSRVKKAMLKMGVAEEKEGELVLTDLGDRFINDEDEDALARLLLDYEPYKEFLEGANNGDTVKKSEVATFFEEEYGMTKNTSKAAAVSMFKLADTAGLGDYHKGYGNRDTRLVGDSGRIVPTFEEQAEDDETEANQEETSLFIEFGDRREEVVIEEEIDWEMAENTLNHFKKKWKRR
jgi:hypothetical protein